MINSFFFSKKRILLILLIIPFITTSQEYTLGVGKYPGMPAENFSPILKVDNTYRNLALLRPAYQSGSYDYNLTAQLITDGIKDTILPAWTTVATSDKNPVKKKELEYIFDKHVSGLNINGPEGWIEIGTGGTGSFPQCDSIVFSGNLLLNGKEAKTWDIKLSGSIDGNSWEEIGRFNGNRTPAEIYPAHLKWTPRHIHMFDFAFVPSKNFRSYKANLSSPEGTSWRITEVSFFKNNNEIYVGGPYSFTSAWKSPGNKEEWVYVDLGNICSIDKVALHWIRKAVSGLVQVSNDASKWITIKTLPADKSLSNTLPIAPVKARYVRILMNQPATDEGYILSELEVYGTGGLKAFPKNSPEPKTDRMELAGGAWKVQRDNFVKVPGEKISVPGFNDNDWIVATVPGTVLVSYINAGVIPDPNYSNNQTAISDAYFYSDFWYRTEFVVPSDFKDKHVWLNFSGINWKAEIYFNGIKAGIIDGAFMRGKFEITKYFIPGAKNSIAVKILKNEHPGYATEQDRNTPDQNGGNLGADNPTFHASVGWDWIPTIRGRNTGIWKNVYINTSGPVIIEHPYVKTDLLLPDTSKALLSIEANLVNNEDKEIIGSVQCKIGNIVVVQPLRLNPLETRKIKFEPSSYSDLKISNPKLWWPNGYGAQNLYDATFKFITKDNQVSDLKTFKVGIREMSYSEDGGVLKIWINGRRFIGRGGNWGFPESMLLYRSREYDIAVRHHKEMNFTFIRNWVGQTGDDEFYASCDKYGIMVWQDFWLANPWDGPDPAYPSMFLKNAEDYIKRIRNHPSMALYCGRNEGNPPEIIDTTLRNIIKQFNPEIHYISNSFSGGVSGGGPYWANSPEYYFKERATPKLHSELGMPNVMNIESIRQMLPDSSLWPQNDMWGVHDFCLGGAMRGSTFNQLVTDYFGQVNNGELWIKLAQYINYQGYRSMFEAQGKNRMGMLLWMSHPAWPSMVWQTYDYYFEPTGAYFGCKKASEPLHIQWNALTDSVEVVNYSNSHASEIAANMTILNIDGSIKWQRDTAFDSKEDEIVRCFKMQYPTGLSNIYFIRLNLTQAGKVISENIYYRGLDEGYGKDLLKLPKISLTQETKSELKNNKWYLSTYLANNNKQAAIFVRLKAVREKSRDRILPVFYSDNYITVFPGESKTITLELDNADTRGEKPIVVVEGINLN